MKRTREKTEKMEEEEIRSQMFDSEVFTKEISCNSQLPWRLQVTPAMRDAGSRIVLEPSYCVFIVCSIIIVTKCH